MSVGDRLDDPRTVAKYIFSIHRPWQRAGMVSFFKSLRRLSGEWN